MSPFKTIQTKKTLSQEIVEQIREAIHNKVFVVGDKLPGELALAESFGVSRTAVREALRILEGRGLITIRGGSGAYVTEMQVSHIVDPFYDLLEFKSGGGSLLHLIRIRQVIEPEFAALAAANRSEDDIQFWTKEFGEMQKHESDPDIMIVHDIKFHSRIAEATKNPIAPVVMEPILRLLHKFISFTYTESRAPELALINHERLLKCFIERDSSLARETMKKHMKEAEEHAHQHYQRNGYK